MTEQNTTETVEQTEVFKITDDFALTARKTVKVSPVTEYEADGETITDANVTFEAFQAVIERYSAGEGDEQRNGFVINHDDNAFEAETERDVIAMCVRELNGSPLKTATKTRAGYKVEIVEKYQGVGNDNSEDIRELDDDEKVRLKELGEQLASGIAAEQTAKAEQRQSAFNAGYALQEARAILTSEKDGKRPGDRDWGIFLSEYAPEWAKKAKNAVSEHMTLAKFSMDYWKFAPEDKNSAKSLCSWHGKNRAALAAFVAEKVMSDLTTNKLEAKLKKAFGEGGMDKIKLMANDTVDGEGFTNAANSVLDDLAVTWGKFIDEGIATVEQFNTMNADGKAATLNNITAYHVEYDDLKRGLKSCVLAEMTNICNRKSEAQVVAEQVQETKDSLPTVTRGFVNFTQEEAAEHVANILVSREDCFELLDMIEDAMNAIMEKRDAQQEVDDEDAQEADEQAVG